MSKSIQIQIPKPCHENWNTMDETTKGRFCNSCWREVIDFSLMSDSQIVQYMSRSHQNVCGRFANDQLVRNLIMKKERKLPFLKYFIHVIIPALLISNKTSAQGKTVGDTVVCMPPKLINDDTAKKTIVMGGISSGVTIKQNFILIEGEIIDTHHSPVPYAAIRIKGEKNGVSSDADGNFKLVVHGKKDQITLVISSVGYEMLETHVNLKTTQNGVVEVLIPMTVSSSMGLAEVVIVSPKKKKLVDTISNVINRFQPKISVKIYPNPVYRGGEFTLDFDVENFGQYNMMMLNSAGQIVMEKKIQISSKRQTEQIICDGRLVPGIYILQIIEQSTKKNYTNKIDIL